MIDLSVSMDAVQISNVTKAFGAVTAVDGLSLTVPEGSVYGFIGPNGSDVYKRQVSDLLERAPGTFPGLKGGCGQDCPPSGEHPACCSRMLTSGGHL